MTPEVVFVTGRDPSRGLGGGSSYVRAHARAACLAGFEPHVFCVDERDGVDGRDFGVVHRVASSLLPRGLSNAALGARPQSFLAQWAAATAVNPYTVAVHGPRLAAAVERHLARRPGPHLVHGFYTWGCVGLAVRERLRRRGAETVVVNSVYTTAADEARARTRGATASGSVLQRAVFGAERLWIRHVVARYERAAYARSALVLLNYESVRRRFEDEHGASERTRRLPYASEAAFLRDGATGGSPAPAAIAALEPRDAPLVVSVSRHDPRKGLDVLVRALADLRARGVAFRACLVSGGPLLGTHGRLVERLGLSGAVALTGWVPDAYAYLRHADVFALPSLQEGSGSVSLLEALQAGVAVVASDVDGIPEDVADGDDALLVPPGDVAAWSRALDRALTDAALRERLRRRAHETYAERFSARAFGRAIGATYESLGFPGDPAAVERAEGPRVDSGRSLVAP